MECNTCKQLYVGYTTSNLPKRFSNHKSHIKKGFRSCKLVNHFLDIDHSLDFSTVSSFNTILSAHLTVKLVDSLEFDDSISKLDREKRWNIGLYYQTQLKTLERYGGMNTLDSNLCNFFFNEDLVKTAFHCVETWLAPPDWVEKFVFFIGVFDQNSISRISYFIRNIIV